MSLGNVYIAQLGTSTQIGSASRRRRLARVQMIQARSPDGHASGRTREARSRAAREYESRTPALESLSSRWLCDLTFACDLADDGQRANSFRVLCVPGRTFCTSSSPALAGRGAALYARSALPLRSRPARPGSTRTTSRAETTKAYRPGARSILVRSQCHRPRRAHQPRYAQLDVDPGPALNASLPDPISGPGPPPSSSRVDPPGTVHEAARTTRKGRDHSDQASKRTVVKSTVPEKSVVSWNPQPMTDAACGTR